MDRDENDDLPKRPCYRCDHCCASFADFNTLAVHFKTNCPKYFHHPSHSAAVIPPEITRPPEMFQHYISAADGMGQQVTNTLQRFQNPSQFASQMGSNTPQNAEYLPQAVTCVNRYPQAVTCVNRYPQAVTWVNRYPQAVTCVNRYPLPQAVTWVSRYPQAVTGVNQSLQTAECVNQSLLNRLRPATGVPQIPKRASLCMENLSSAMIRKVSTFRAFAASCADVKKIARKFSEVAQQKNLDLEAYTFALGRKNALCTISSEQELLILNDVVSKALAKVKIAFKNEEIIVNLLRQAIDVQKKANEEAALVTTLEQTAFTLAIDTFKEEMKSQTEESRAVYEEFVNTKNVRQSSAHLINLQEKAQQLQNLILSVLRAASKAGYENECSRKDRENAAAALSDIPREWLSTTESYQIQQIMDLERAEVDALNGLASSRIQATAGPSEHKN